MCEQRSSASTGEERSARNGGNATRGSTGRARGGTKNGIPGCTFYCLCGSQRPIGAQRNQSCADRNSTACLRSACG